MVLKVTYVPLQTKANLRTKLSFGKYKGFTVQEILDYDWKYIKYIHNRHIWFEVNTTVREIVNEKKRIALKFKKIKKPEKRFYGYTRW